VLGEIQSTGCNTYDQGFEFGECSWIEGKFGLGLNSKYRFSSQQPKTYIKSETILLAMRSLSKDFLTIYGIMNLRYFNEID